MITASQIADLRTASVDFEETEHLKAKLAKLQRERPKFFLAGEEFDEILRWKLRGQYGRQRSRRALNTEELIQTITGIASTIIHLNKEHLCYVPPTSHDSRPHRIHR